MFHTFPEQDFSLRPHYIRRLSENEDHCMCLVSKKWLEKIVMDNCRRTLLTPPDPHPRLTDTEVQLLLNRSDALPISDPWMRLELYRIPLMPSALLNRRCFPIYQADAEHESLSEEEKMDLQLNEMQTNAFLRKHAKSVHAMSTSKTSDVCTALDAVRYLCASILGCPFLDFSEAPVVPHEVAHPPNIQPPIFVACMVDHFVVAFPFRPITLTSCLRFSSGLVATEASSAFVLFQILYVIAYFQQNDFYVGDIRTDHLSMKENLWIEMKPISVFTALCSLQVAEPPVGQRNGNAEETEEDDLCKLSEWTSLWCLGKISNYDYLYAVNNAAGRDFTPDYYPIFPWVTDFTSPDGWRDLTRSKYHLTKGDRQLDLTFNTLESGMVPHHIPETFSDLTFYIYNARRIPKSVLAQYVRKKFVPAEYPASMERLYKWTPDECIPEFYSDPSILKSIHSDLPDLGLPSWCHTVDDFLNFHRFALEHPRVTNALHHWFDLNFGYKLSGEAAVTAKNVVLSLAVPQTRLKNHGINQIFKVAHPPRFQSVPWYLKPKMPALSSRKKKSRNVVQEDTISVSSEDFSEEAVLEMENVSENMTCQSVTTGYTAELKALESLLELCFSLDHDQPKILEDFVGDAASLDVDKSSFLRRDLQAFAGVALQVLCRECDSSKIQPQHIRSRASHGRSNGFALEPLVESVRALFSADTFPYSAMQLLQGHDTALGLPDWISYFHLFLCKLKTDEVDMDALESAMDAMTADALSVIAPFLRDLLASDDRVTYVALLLDSVTKFIGSAGATEIFGKLLSRIHIDAPTGFTCNELLQTEFLNNMLVRFGTRNFLRLFVMPLIEKLADVQLDYTIVDPAGKLNEQLVFLLKDEDKVDDKVSLSSLTEHSSVQMKIVSALTWLAEELGPALCAQHITANLLKSLSLCYADVDRLKAVNKEAVGTLKVAGDMAALGVVESLLQVVLMYGRSFIWNQYFPYAAELAKSALRNLTSLNAAGLIGCMEMMALLLSEDSGLIPDDSLLEYLPSQIVREVLYPVVKLLTSTSHLFPLGTESRRILAMKWIDLIYVLSSRIGREEARENFTDPLLISFFGVFSQLHEDQLAYLTEVKETSDSDEQISSIPTEQAFGSPFTTIHKDSFSGELKIGSPVTASLDSLPTSPEPSKVIHPHNFNDDSEVLCELKEVFTESLAFDTYVSFCRLLGQFHMNEKLVNGDLLHEICSNRMPPVRQVSQSIPVSLARPATRFRGSSQTADVSSETHAGTSVDASQMVMPASLRADDIQEKSHTAPVDRVLEGNWLAHWQYELGQGRPGETWNIKQIPLQTFTAHSGPVKSILVLDSENSFISGGKDKSVRLWNIRNCGSGNDVSQAQGLYVEHKRPVTELRFLARERLVASCDGTVHIWDPWTTSTLGRIELSTAASCLDCSAAPGSVVFVGHGGEQRSYVSRFDVRVKTSASNSGQFVVTVPSDMGSLLRTLVVSPDDTWFACGFSSGIISIFEQRTGMLLATWKPYDNEVQELLAISASVLASVGPDNIVSLWDIKRDVDDRLVRKIGGLPEAVIKTVLTKHGDEADALILMNGSRVGVAANIQYDGVGGGSEVVTTKVRHDMVKGHFSAMNVLPMNRQLLLGSETGNILLMC